MSKYKIVGILNLLSGMVQIVYPLLGVFIVIPKMLQLYSQVSVNPSVTLVYLAYAGMFIVGLFNLFLAYKLLKALNNKEKYFKLGIVMLVFSLISWGFLSNITTSTIVDPLYNLNTQL